MKQIKYLIVGFSGSGKTHLLKSKLSIGKSGNDLDGLILNELKGDFHTTRELILDIGIDKFREVEFKLLKDWISSSTSGEYLALGGGAIHEKSLEYLNRRNDWKAIYLNKNFDECWRGLIKRGHSFLIEVGRERANDLFEKRTLLYNRLANLEEFCLPQ